MSTYLLPHYVQKVQPVRLNDGHFEVEVIISCLHVVRQGGGGEVR